MILWDLRRLKVAGPKLRGLKISRGPENFKGSENFTVKFKGSEISGTKYKGFEKFGQLSGKYSGRVYGLKKVRPLSEANRRASDDEGSRRSRRSGKARVYRRRF